MTTTRRALVTGAAGQDGHYLTRYLVDRGREVLGLSRRQPETGGTARAVSMDITRHADVRALVEDFAPDEIYHLAAYHRSSASQVSLTEAEEEDLYFRHNVEATRALLRATWELRPHCRVFLAGSCHLFGDADVSPQNERTPIRPNSLYGITKAANFWLARHYRKKHDLFCVTGILYNHESPLRGPTFVTGRIARTVAQIARGEATELVLGDLEAQVDWGFAGDYVQAMVTMLEAEIPDDYVIASGRLRRVRDFVKVAFAHVGLDWRKHVRQKPGLHHPVAQAVYCGDATAIQRLGWSPRLSFDALVQAMVDVHLGGQGSSP